MPSGKLRGAIRVRGGATAARDCIIVLRTALNWAVSEGPIQDHPASSFKLLGGNTRQAFLEDHEQHAQLFAALDRLEEEHAICSSVAKAFRLTALTGARPTEITRCQWQHVNLKTGVITLPLSRHKTDKATGFYRTITLPPVFVEIIARQPWRRPDYLP
jgi:integrase